MSLINEALKKAQAQRQSSDGSSPTTPPPASPPGTPPFAVPPPASASSPGSGKLLLAVLLVAVLFATGAGLLVWGLLRSGDNGETTRTAATAPSTATESAGSHNEATPALEAATPLPPIEFKLDEENASAGAQTAEGTRQEEAGGNPKVSEAGVPAPASEPPISETPSSAASPVSEPPTSETPVGASPATNPAPPPSSISNLPSPAANNAASPRQPPPGVVADPAVEEFIADLEVRGVMSGGKKALIYDPVTQHSRAYSVGSTISNELQVKVEEISETSIAFIDNAGYIYTKSF